MRSFGLSIFLLLICAAPLFAALHFPALTGRVVDEAHVLSPSAVSALDQTLADYERGTTNQVVVVTVPSLQDTSIEDYGYQLGRFWDIGQKEKNNGVLLIVAPQEHKVRIEVGYGLEGTLTDAASSEIVQGIILPQFRAGRIEKGVIDGTQAIVDVLGGKSIPGHQYTNQANEPTPVQAVLWLLFLLWFLWFAYHHPWMAAYMINSSRFGSSGLSGSGGGFSGGGGSFGGGGASGGW